MNLDKRIKDISDILSVINSYGKYRCLMGKAGYFAKNIKDFKNLNKCKYGTNDTYKVDNECFCHLKFTNGIIEETWYPYFILEDALLLKEKKYRAFTNEEFVKLFDSGKLHSIRLRDSSTRRLERLIITDIYVQGDYLYAKLNSSTTGYSPEYFFSNCEYLDGKEWKPFGVEEKE